MNTFDLRFFVEQHTQEQIDYGEGTALVYQKIWIDGQHLDEPYSVCLNDLTRSLFYPGEFKIFTCGCGYAGCASIFDGIFVRHEPGLIRWRFRRPVSCREFGTADDDGYDDWIQKALWSEYAFDRNQMLTNIANALNDIRIQTDIDASYCPYGFERTDLDALNPHGQLADIPFEERTGQSLFFLADEENQFLLDGRFVTMDCLNLTKSFQRRFQDWLQIIHSSRLDPENRKELVEDAITFLTDAYHNGLSTDTTLWMITRRLTDCTLDPWNQEKHPVKRE
ncbi:MAG: hypothetical protein HOP23_04315 [Methylococcaceae bacterium]|nr:hypothetical protein [Methylococcaceae bacterium]